MKGKLLFGAGSQQAMFSDHGPAAPPTTSSKPGAAELGKASRSRTRWPRRPKRSRKKPPRSPNTSAKPPAAQEPSSAPPSTATPDTEHLRGHARNSHARNARPRGRDVDSDPALQ